MDYHTSVYPYIFVSYLYLVKYIIYIKVLPFSLLLNYFYKYSSERYMIKILTICSLISCFAMIRFSIHGIHITQFLFFYSVLFISASLLESVDSNLLIKIMPYHNNKTSHKLLNPALALKLKTSAGRATGSLLVTIFGIYGGIESIQNYTFLSFSILYLVVYVLVLVFYNDLKVKAISRIIKKNYC